MMLLGLNTEQSFQSVLALIMEEQYRPDCDHPASFMLVTGDIAQTPSKETYRHFFDTINHLQCPFAWLEGNHDQLDLDEQPPYHNVVELGTDWLILLLNSTARHQTQGLLAHDELTWLAGQLARYPQRHIMIAMHHHPLPVHSEWLDAFGLTNAEAFWQLIDQHPQVRAIVHGHVHQAFEARRNAVQVYACPSTCIQFLPQSKTFSIDTCPPGYRWYDLYPDGRITSQVSRLKDLPGGIDFSAAGY